MKARTESKIRWLYLLISTLILIFGGLIYGWSFFARYFKEIFPFWSSSGLSMTFTISMTCFCIGGFAAGKLLQKISQRYILWASAILILLGFWGVSGMDASDVSTGLMKLYMFYGILAGLGVGACYNVVISVTGKWFPDKSGVSTGTMMMGFGSGALILSSIAEAIINSSDLFHAFKVIGIGCFLVLMAGSFILKYPESSLEGMARPDQKLTEITGEDKPTAEVLRTTSFWIFFLWAVVINIAGFAILGNAATIAAIAGAPALMGLIVSVFNGAGRILVGSFYDRFRRIKTMMLDMSLLLISSLLLILGTVTLGTVTVILGLIFAGLAIGGSPIICSSFVRSQYGMRYYPTNFALINFSVIPAALAGPGAASLLYDASGGSYMGTYIIMTSCVVVGAVLFRLLNKTAKDAGKL